MLAAAATAVVLPATAADAPTPDARRLLVSRADPTSDALPLLYVIDPATRRSIGVITMPYSYRIAAAPDGHDAVTASGGFWLLDIP